MSDNEYHEIAEQNDTTPDEAEIVTESVTKPKKQWNFTPARKAALEKAHIARAKKAAENKKKDTEVHLKAVEIVEDRRLQTTAEDDKLDHVLYELEKIKKHINPSVSKDIPKNLRPPPPARRSRKKEPEPDTESDLTETDYSTTETESTRPSRRKKNPPPAEKSQDYQPPPRKIMFG